MRSAPLVSCLCISYNRLNHLKNAITYFQAQGHRNKELIVISGVYDPQYEELCYTFYDEGVRYYGLVDTEMRTLGELRNFAIEKANGEYFCMWDDDDWYNCNRIECQLKELTKSKKEGTVLPYYILYDSVNKDAYMSIPMPPPASILCKKTAITKDLLYRELNRSEDSLFLYNLNQKNTLFPLINPILYIYTYHGSNTWDIAHFKQFCGKKFSEKTTTLIANIVESKYSCKQGSKLLNSKSVLAEFDYFQHFTSNTGNFISL